MAGRRVVVDLSEFYLDHRRKSLIFVDRSSVKHIGDLIEHICKIFNLPDDFEIFISDAHVPRAERADIIQESDVLRLVKVTSQFGVCEQSRNGNHEILSHDVVIPSKKKKKRKVSRDEDDKLMEQSTSETQSSNVTFSSEPKKKKKKKKCVDEAQDYCGETSFDSKTLKCESGKGKKKSNGSSNELPQNDLLDKSTCNGDDNLENHFVTKTDHQSESENLHESVKISLIKQSNEWPQYDVLDKKICNGDDNLDNPFDIKTDSQSKPENLNDSDQISPIMQTNTMEGESKCFDSVCESFDCSIGSNSVKKKRRQRKRRRPKKAQHNKIPSFNEPETTSFAPLHTVATKRIKDMVNRCHIIFSDVEEDENVNESPENGIKCEEWKGASSNVAGVNSSVCENMGVDSLKNSEEFCMDDKAEDSQRLTQKIDAECDDHGNDQQMALDDSNSMKCEDLTGHRICEKRLICDSVAKECDVESNVNMNDNVSCNKIVSSEDCPSNSGEWFSAGPPRGRGNRRRNAIIAMGLGSTLSQLMKDSNSTNKVENITLKEVSCESPQTVSVPRPKLSDEKPKQKTKERYSGFPILEKLPQKNDILVFKILKLNERYEPTISSHLKGKVMDCNGASTLVTMEVLGGTQELMKTCGKFDVVDEGDITTAASKGENEQMILQLKWNEFIEPRLMFP